MLATALIPPQPSNRGSITPYYASGYLSFPPSLSHLDVLRGNGTPANEAERLSFHNQAFNMRTLSNCIRAAFRGVLAGV
jgi:hypothetical protein